MLCSGPGRPICTHFEIGRAPLQLTKLYVTRNLHCRLISRKSVAFYDAFFRKRNVFTICRLRPPVLVPSSSTTYMRDCVPPTRRNPRLVISIAILSGNKKGLTVRSPLFLTRHFRTAVSSTIDVTLWGDMSSK